MAQANYKLPDMEHRFSIQIKGDESGLMWVGEFVYRRPTLVQRGQIERFRTILDGDLVTIRSDITILHTALAHLRFTLQEAPGWWKAADNGGALYDANVVTEVYDKCINFEADWRKKVLGGDPKEVEEGNHNVGSEKPEQVTAGSPA